MTYPINNQNQQLPGYSGITINITNPNITAGHNTQNYLPQQGVGGQNCEMVGNSQYSQTASVYTTNPMLNNQPAPQYYHQDFVRNSKMLEQNGQNVNRGAGIDEQGYGLNNNQFAQNVPQNLNVPQNHPQQSYPPEYYINNYNNINNNLPAQQNENVSGNDSKQTDETKLGLQDLNKDKEDNLANNEAVEKEVDMSSSKSIISDLDEKLAEQKDLEKNGKKTRVVALTNEYIMSLENYLNNPNTEIRLMAAKEILTRLDEDKDRYNDAALNALLNKMLQDPEKLIRIASMSAFSSQLASGNDYTIKLLNDIQANPNSDKEDVVEAANILLKMSSSTEIKYSPQEKPVENNVAEQNTVPTQA